MFPGNYADLVYNNHQVAYHDRFQVQDILREWLRILKPGGILRLTTPDFEKVVEVYLRNRDLSEHLGSSGWTPSTATSHGSARRAATSCGSTPFSWALCRPRRGRAGESPRAEGRAAP